MSWTGRSVLVTGAAGFLGSHLCHRLFEAGARVTAADNLAFARPDAALPADGPGFHSVSVDLRDEAALRQLVDAAAPETVFHLAAIANPRTCKQDFGLAFDVNVRATHQLLGALPPKARVVFMSSAAVYGEPLYVPIDEAHPRRGSDPYSVTKILGEALCENQRANYGRSIVIVRNFNTFGVGQTGDYILPTLIRQGLTDRKIEIWNGTPIRDLTFVDNTIDALLAVGASDVPGPINLGSGRGLQIGELARTIAATLGDGIPVVDLGKSVIGSPVLVANNQRLRDLGWSERISFAEGIRRTIDWTRQRLAAAG